MHTAVVSVGCVTRIRNALLEEEDVMFGKWLLAAVCVVGLAGAQTALAHDDWGRGDRRGPTFGVGVYSFVHEGHHYWHGYHHPHYGPPVIVKPYPYHPPVIIVPPRHDDCHRPRYYGYSRSHGGLGIYGPRFGFSLRW